MTFLFSPHQTWIVCICEYVNIYFSALPDPRHQAQGSELAMCRSSHRIPCDVCLSWQGMWHVLAFAAQSQEQQQQQQQIVIVSVTVLRDFFAFAF